MGLEILGNNETWISIRREADQILNKLEIKSRTYNTDYTNIISNDGEVIFKGNKIKNR